MGPKLLAAGASVFQGQMGLGPANASLGPEGRMIVVLDCGAVSRGNPGRRGRPGKPHQDAFELSAGPG
jgi:hypothetical protein